MDSSDRINRNRGRKSLHGFMGTPCISKAMGCVGSGEVPRLYGSSAVSVVNNQTVQKFGHFGLVFREQILGCIGYELNNTGLAGIIIAVVDELNPFNSPFNF
jgi:hypothetical protein